jgi:ribosomal protein S18 acetylase RimI-like enzyme
VPDLSPELVSFPLGYRLRGGAALDRALLVKFVQRTYAEIDTVQPGSHLAQMVDQYLTAATPLWWVDAPKTVETEGPFLGWRQPVACLWVGNAVDQISGDRHAHIFLLYVAPEHRRQGLGKALMQQAEAWARERGDRQIGLQVFQTNQPALALYQGLGFSTQSLWMTKPLGPE